ncbi:MAG: zf-HC2 domain-containing protein [Anaerolineae bacterium]|nr:zf-HC2 domain-containing protein [Anaerolineae bacterium]
MIGFRRRSNETRDHKYFEERLSAYLDGELAAREQQAVEQHLKVCERCPRELATLKQTVVWLSELPVVPVPRVFTIPANVVPAPPVRRRWSFVPAMQFATALVAVLLFFAAAGDVMLTGWPWGTMAEPMMLQEAAVEQSVAEMPAAKEAESTLEVEVAAYAEPYGASDTAATEPAMAEVAAEAAEEAPAALQQAAPEAAPRAAALTQPAPGEGVGGGEGAGEEREAPEDVARVEADTPPVLQSTSAPEEPLAGMPESLPTATPERMSTSAPASLPAATLAPKAVIVPTPTAAPTIHLPVTEAVEPPGALVQVPESWPPAEARNEAELPALTRGETGQAVFWLRVVEYVLGVALVILTGTMIVLMVWRRARGR